MNAAVDESDNARANSLGWTSSHDQQAQRRLRHLSRILIRNLTDVSAKNAPPRRPSLPRGASADDLDLELRRKKGKSRRISLTVATRERKSSTSSLESPTRPLHRHRTVSSASIRLPAAREEEEESDADDGPLSPLPKLKRERATSRASVLSLQSSSSHLREQPVVDHQSHRAHSQPLPEVVLTLSQPDGPGKGKAPACFYASDVQQSRNPSFELDPTDLLRGREEDSQLLRGSRVVAELWVKTADESAEWKVHTQWDLDLAGLSSIGRDLTSLATPVPTNALIIALVNGDHLTLPTLHAHSPLSRIDAITSPSLGSNEDTDDDPGSLSDPGGSVDALRERANRRALQEARRKDRERRKRAIENSVRETRMLPSIGVGGIVRLLTLQTVIDDTRASVLASRVKLSRLVEDPTGLPALRRQAGDMQERIKQREVDLEMSTRDAGEAETAYSSQRFALDERRRRLDETRSLVREQQAAVEAGRIAIEGQTSEHTAMQSRIVTRRAQHITSLESIFPIQPILDAGPLLFSIASVKLPNSSFDPSGADDEFVSTALGSTAQFITLLAHYLATVLPYPLIIRGSRSLITDNITGSIRGPRAFPLYSRGVERYRFDYAVFLLNKDVEHLLVSHRPRPVAVLDLKQTLPNLYNLTLTATSEMQSPPANGSPPRSALARVEEQPDSESEPTDDEEESRPASIRSGRSISSTKTVRPGQRRTLSSEKATGATEKLKALQKATV